MDFKTFAVEMALACGDNILMRRYGETFTIEWSARRIFRTEVDLESGRFMRAEIERVFPDHGIHSEEEADKAGASEYEWILDEVDGTLGFMTGINDLFSVNIALRRNKVIIVGVTYAPKRGELFVSELDKGATLNGVPMRVSDETELSHVMMGMDGGKDDRLSLMRVYAKLLVGDGIAADLKHGCASVPLALVASGKMHAYAAMQLQLEDMAPGVLHVREAGGTVTDIKGNKWNGQQSILAANPVLHAKLLERIR